MRKRSRGRIKRNRRRRRITVEGGGEELIKIENEKEKKKIRAGARNASNGQRYPLPRSTHYRNLYLNQSRVADLTEMMSYRTRENFHPSVEGWSLMGGGLGP